MDNPTNFQVIWSLFEYICSYTLCYANTNRINVFWCMTRGNPSELRPIDPAIDRNFHKGRRHLRNSSLHVDYSVTFPDSSDSPHTPNTPHFLHSEHTVYSEHSDFNTDNMTQPLPPHERTMSELTALEFTYDSFCIQYPEEEVPYVLKIGLIHLLPKFHGFAGEDPCKHLKQFHVMCSTMKLADVQEDHVYLKAFPHSLEGNAKDWLYYLAPRSITSWDDLKRLFLAKFFLALRTTAIRKEISGIKQQSRETLYEYWERFKNLCSSCPHHQISEHLLLQYFYEVLHHMDRNMIDVASGGALGNMTHAAARQLIENMASNSQQFGTKSDAIVVRGFHDVGAAEYTKKLESKIDALTTLVNQLASNQRAPAARVCGLCTSVDYFIDFCPTLQQQAASSSTPIDTPQVYASNIFNNNKPQHQQQNHDLSTNRYNPGCRNHPNLRWGNQGNQPQQNQQFQNMQQPPQYRVTPTQVAHVPPVLTPVPAPVAPAPSSSTSLEELVRMMTL